VLVGFLVVFQSWLMRGGAFGGISVATILNSIVSNLVQIVGGISGHGVWLIIGSVAGQAASLIFCIFIVSRAAEPPVWRFPEIQKLVSLLKEHRRFPQISLPFTMLSLLRDRAPIFIIGAFHPPSLVGLYSQAWRLTHFPCGITSAALRPVFFHRTATEGLTAQGEVVDRLVRWLLVASSPWIALAVFGNDALFIFLLGPQWRGAGSLAAVLVLPAALFTITNWMDRLLDAVGRQDVNLKVEMVAGLGSVSILWIALANGASLTLAVVLQNAALAMSYAGFIWTCYGIAGWTRSKLVMSMFAAFWIGGLTYLLLTILGLVMSETGVFLAGATFATLIALALLVMAQRYWHDSDRKLWRRKSGGPREHVRFHRL
jgi:O-antigen/teichoic acid export membrane protein